MGSDGLTMADAVHELRSELGIMTTLEDRTIVLPEPVKGSPHLAVLQAIGLAATDHPVGAAAHGPAGVAAGVWRPPDLYVVRWTGASRWVAHYRFSSRGRPDDYLREESGIPSSLNRDNWYAAVPEAVAEVFLDVGLLLDEPPFPVPEPAPPRAPETPRRAPRSESEPTGTTPASNAPRTSRPRKPPAPPRPKKAVPAMRTCVMCNMQKHASQFEDGSDLCVDCR